MITRARTTTTCASRSPPVRAVAARTIPPDFGGFAPGAAGRLRLTASTLGAVALGAGTLRHRQHERCGESGAVQVGERRQGVDLRHSVFAGPDQDVEEDAFV